MTKMMMMKNQTRALLLLLVFSATMAAAIATTVDTATPPSSVGKYGGRTQRCWWFSNNKKDTIVDSAVVHEIKKDKAANDNAFVDANAVDSKKKKNKKKIQNKAKEAAASAKYNVANSLEALGRRAGNVIREGVLDSFEHQVVAGRATRMETSNLFGPIRNKKKERETTYW
jgi:hypothetical protein